MSKHLIQFGVALAVIAAFSLSAQAVTTTFFGEDQYGGANGPHASYPNSLAAQTNFLADLTGVGTETFESFSNGQNANGLVLTFPGAGNATLAGSSISILTDTSAGRWATSGINYVSADTTAFSITFDSPVAAFGFYGTDIGDFGGQLTVNLTHVGGGTELLTVPNTIGSGGSTNGSVLYFGVINTDSPITSLSFGDSNTEDVFGFDDMTIGSVQQVTHNPGGAVPEPLSASLVGLSLLGLGALTLRRRAQA